MEKKYSLKFTLAKALLFFLAFTFNLEPAIATDLLYNTAAANENEWVYHSESKGVRVSYLISRCGKEDVVFLKFENTNSDSVTVEWEEEFWTDSKHVSKGVEGKKSISLNPGITSKLDCSSPENSSCIVLASQIDPTRNSKILKYNISNILVSRQ